MSLDLGVGLRGAERGSYGLKSEPRRRVRCAVCKKRLEVVTGHEWAVSAGRADPFCSAACCRVFHGVPSVEPPERYPAASTVRTSSLLCLRCKAWKPDAGFANHRGRPKRRYRSGWCKECKSEENRRRYAEQDGAAVQAARRAARA